MTTLLPFWPVATTRQSDDESQLHTCSEIYQSQRWSYGRVYPKLSQLTKAAMTSEAASPGTRVSGQVDQFPLTKSLNPSNERYCIQSNEICWPMTAIEHRLRRSCNYKIMFPLNASIHGWSPTKSEDNIRVNLLHFLPSSSLTIAFLTPTEETRAHLRRRASPVEALLRQRRRKDKGKKKEKTHPPWKHTRCGRPTTIMNPTKSTSIMNDRDRLTISPNTAYRRTWIRWSILMTNSDLFGWPSRMTPNTLSAEVMLNLHPAAQQSIELCTGRYENA